MGKVEFGPPTPLSCTYTPKAQEPSLCVELAKFDELHDHASDSGLELELLHTITPLLLITIMTIVAFTISLMGVVMTKAFKMKKMTNGYNQHSLANLMELKALSTIRTIQFNYCYRYIVVNHIG
jgi:hypothetical protein